jgi:hypothetical protein
MSTAIADNLGGERVDFWDRMKSIVLSFWREEQAD